MLRVGLTGGLASGKSTVSEILRELGAAVLDADEIVRAPTARAAPGPPRPRPLRGRRARPTGDRPDPIAALVFSDRQPHASGADPPLVEERRRFFAEAEKPAPGTVVEASQLFSRDGWRL
jgi:dephospho-CoA kinase